MRDHRVPGALMSLDLLVDVRELRVPVRVPSALDHLGVALQAEPIGPQQVPDGIGVRPGDPAGQFARQPTCGSTYWSTAAAKSDRRAPSAPP